MSRKIIRPIEVMARAALGNTAIYEYERDGLLPAFFKINGSRASGIFEDELDEVLDARAAGATDGQVREIVRRQVARRKARLDELRVA